MVRQNYFVNTSQKQMEVFSSFGGGMVTQAHPEKLKDNQSILIENADIIQGDVLQARGAYSLVNECDVIHFNTMADLYDEEITFDDLSTHTMDELKNIGLTRNNVNSSLYFTTMEQWKLEKITFNNLKEYTMDQLKTQGVTKPNTGDSQGMFRYYSKTSYQDIVAINGKLYTIVDNLTYKKLPITGLRNFQTTKTIEAVQYRDKLYIATGSGIVIYDGTSAYMMTAYKPNGLEALYIGTNGYAEDPSNYLQNTVGVGIAILGVTVDKRYGITNNNITFTAYYQSPVGSSLEFLFETKKLADSTYVMAQDWSSSNVLVKSFSSADDYMVQVSVRVSGTTLTLNQYVLPKYTINSTASTKPENDDVNYDNLASCNRILVHYDRLFIYGDDAYNDYLYISHLNDFTYFPRTNIIKVTDPLRGELQRVVRYKKFLICFTNGSIQMLEGISPTDYALSPVHTTLGTTHRDSVQIMKNYIVFVGNDNGVYVLRSFAYSSDDKLNVERLDSDVRDSITTLISTSTKILSAITNNQYFLYVQTDTQNYVYRFYYDYMVWVRDTIELSFQTLVTLDNNVTACDTNNGIIYRLKSDVFKDGKDKSYVMKVQSKSYNFNMPHHKKKLKQYQLITNLSSISSIIATVYADNTLLTTKPLNYDPNQDAAAQKLNVMASGRFRCIKTELSIRVKEPIQLIGFGFVFKQNTPK
jgi:hypothetical protein